MFLEIINPVKFQDKVLYTRYTLSDLFNNTLSESNKNQSEFGISLDYNYHIYIVSSRIEVKNLIGYINNQKIKINYLFNYGMTPENIQKIYNTFKKYILHDDYSYNQKSILDLKSISKIDETGEKFKIINLLVQIEIHLKKLPESEGGNKYYKKYLKYKYKYLQAKNRLLK